MTDAEIICEWMDRGHMSVWWIECQPPKPDVPRSLTLDALWEVEERLTDDEWRRYGWLLIKDFINLTTPFILSKARIHATAQ